MSLILDGSNGLTFPNSTVQASAGNVLQVVTATYSTQVSINTNTYTDTGLTATITPKFSTSKILVLVTQPYRLASATSTNSVNGGTQLLRNSTVIYAPVADSSGPYIFGLGTTTTNNPNVRGGYTLSYVDSPATTSATTYKTQGRRYDSATTLVVQETDSNGTNTSTITLMEIAA